MSYNVPGSPGSYSKHCSQLEKIKMEQMNRACSGQRSESIVRSKQLTAETNRRRRALMVKKKAEANKEEKRRKEILSSRRQKHKDVTEKYQRSPVKNKSPPGGAKGNDHPSSPIERYAYNSPAVQDALKAIRSTPRQTSFSAGSSGTPNRKAAAPRGQGQPNRINSCSGRRDRIIMHTNDDDNDVITSPYSNNYGTSPHRTSPSSRDRIRAEHEHRSQLQETSGRNMENSRSLFEQHLDSYQKLIMNPTQGREPGVAVKHELGNKAGPAAHGIEDRMSRDMDSDSFSDRDSLDSDSLSSCSADSLDDGNSNQ